VGAFVPLMENGGGGNHFPWLFDNGTSTETTDIYRNFVNIHHQLKPYFLSAGTTAFTKGVSVITPLALSVYEPDHSWDYYLWTDIFVAPIVESGLQRTVDFPSGNNWIYWFNSSQIYTGDNSVTLTFPLSEFPAYHRSGSILPLYMDNHPYPYFHGALTALVHPVFNNKEKTVVRRWRAPSTELGYIWNEEGFEFIATASDQNLVLVINGVTSCPESIYDKVYLRSIPALESPEYLSSYGTGYYCDPSEHSLTLYNHDSSMGASFLIKGLQSLYY